LISTIVLREGEGGGEMFSSAVLHGRPGCRDVLACVVFDPAHMRGGLYAVFTVQYSKVSVCNTVYVSATAWGGGGGSGGGGLCRKQTGSCDHNTTGAGQHAC
jgi:hypothetical protein